MRLEAVHRSFGPVAALDGVSLEVSRGEIFGIIGRSGAGKSTLIRTVNGLERIDSGRIIVEGSELASLDEAGLDRIRRNIGMIFQHFNLLAMKTVFENVELPLKLAGWERRVRREAVWRMLDVVGLRDKADMHPARFDAAVINTNYALQAKFHPREDAIAIESSTDNPYGNVIVVRIADKDKPVFKTLVAAYQSDEVRRFILGRFDGAVLPVF